MFGNVIALLKKEYRMKSVDAGVYKKLVIQGVDFTIESYDAIGLGRVSVMRARGLMGLIKRDVLVISPLEREVPVITCERYNAFGKGQFIWTQNDLVNPVEEVKAEGKNKELVEYDAFVEERITAYLEQAKHAKKCDELVRRDPIFEYVDEVIDTAKLLSDFYIANYGLEHTIKVYHNIMFGTK